MKRFLVILSVLLIGAGLGAGGLYVGLNWAKFDPFRKANADDVLKEFIAQLRKACTTDPALKGSIVKSAEMTNGKLALHGLVARKDQVALLEAKAQELLEASRDLKSQCTAGFATDGLKVLPIHELVATLLQPDPADKTPPDGLKHQVMRTTRLDAVAFGEDGRLTFTGVCVRGNTKTEASNDILKDVLKTRIEALGAPATSMPDLALDVRYFPNPAGTLQKQLAGNENAKDVRLSSAWYDAKGQLHVAGIVTRDSERQVVENALAAFAKDPQTAAFVKNAEIMPHLAIFDAAARVGDLQRKWIEYARTQNKPNLRRVLMQQIVPTGIEDAKKQIITDDEGNVSYFFRVTGRLHETANEQADIEKALTAWLTTQLPTVMNADQKAIGAKLMFDVKESPVFALQQRIVQRGLDGAVFTDALFDEKGHLEISGRTHQLDDAEDKALDAAVKDVLGTDLTANLQTMNPHRSVQKGQPIAWKDAVRMCQARLAVESPLSQRIRVDRLYFAYEGVQLRLKGEGAVLTDGATENLDPVLRKAIDDVVASRGQAFVKAAGLKRVRNPLTELQNLTAERPDLDGVLLTNLRYGSDSQLHIDGFLGRPENPAVLPNVLGPRLKQIADLLRSEGNAKTTLGWSIAGLKPYPTTGGDLYWPDLQRVWQGKLATARETVFRRTHLDRAYFKYVDTKPADKDSPPRHLKLHFHATYLAKPQQSAVEVGLTPKLEKEFADLAPRAATITGVGVQGDVTQVDTPIFELQKQAVAKNYDGILFKDASFNRDGKLSIDGIHGNAEQLKQAQELVDQLLANPEKAKLAPTGVAPLGNLKFVAWQPMLADVRTSLAQERTALYKQTRIDGAFFQFDPKTHKPTLHFKGVRIYTGTKIAPKEQDDLILQRLEQQTQGTDLEEFDIDIRGIVRAANPHGDMQRKIRDAIDGALVSEIGFDAKGNCYIKVSNVPPGQEETLRKLIDEFSTQHPHLKTIRQQ